MNELPVWLIEILRQFPMVVVIGFAFWYAEKRVAAKEIRSEERFDRLAREEAERADKLRQEERREKVAEIERHQEMQRSLNKNHEKMLATKDEQIAALTKQLAALTKKLSG